MTGSVSRFLTGSLKIVVAVVVLALMIRGGKLQPHALLASLHHWPTLLAALVLGYGQLALATWRWQLLMAAQDLKLAYWTTFSLTMIGALFNVVLPGSVGGDVMKAYQVGRVAEGRASTAVLTIGVDRILGLLGLLLLATLMVMLNIRLIEKSALRTLWSSTAGMSTGAIGSIAALMTMRQGALRWVGKYPSSWPLSSLVNQLLKALAVYRRRWRVIVVAVAISMVAHGLACIAFYLCVTTLGDPGLQLRLFFVLVPIGLATTAIPVSPSGLGVGQAAFFSLFQFAGHSDPVLGANACLVYQSVMIVIYLTGLYPYLMQRSLAVVR